MWKAIVLVLITVELLQGLSYYRDSVITGTQREKLRKPQKGKERKQKKESDYFNPSGPIPPMGPEL